MQIAVDAHGTWWDPERSAGLVVTGDGGDLCSRLTSRLTAAGAPADEAWLGSWAGADEAAQRVIDGWISFAPELTEVAVARRLVAALPDGATLVVSSSMPIRDVEWYGAARHGVRVLANRGANGIDGVVSTAVGVATAGAGPTSLLIGDVALLHDTNGLLGLAARDLDLTLVVVDNRGGGIFSFLPQASTLPADRFELLFGTPHEVDLPSLLAVHGIPALAVEGGDADGYGSALRAALTTSGTQAVVVRTDRAANVDSHDTIHRAISAAIGG
jgi:2-succinyl-5-enolpyruvyl-6-hydroxy-3-cyclohexene-1-carboxylate synthase